ncbi:MAG: ComEC/Rec2 family competence protein [Kiritimatiellia bacterium]|jgi:beta-lactamase superfamily II metal-dependent hydrolase
MKPAFTRQPQEAGSFRTDGLKPIVTVEKGLGGGRVICCSNRSHWQMASAVFVSPSGRVAVVDGGYYADGDNLDAVLRSLGGTVDYWFLTHAHRDHFGALVSMIEKRADLGGIRIGTLFYDFPETDWLDKTEPTAALNVRRFLAAMATASPPLAVERPRKGQVFDLGDGWTFEVLNDRALDLDFTEVNDTGVCFSVKTGSRTWLLPGDIAVRTSRRLVEELGKRLEHEFVFMSHHGQCGADKCFYAAVKPKTAIWPTPDWLWENDGGSGPSSGSFKTNETKCWMEDLGVREHHVLTEDVVFV